MKKCPKCNIEKELIDFNRKGKDKIQSWCRMCDNEYHRLHYEKNKQYYYEKSKTQRDKNKNYVNSVKIGHSCERCNESDIACLDFHHLNDKDETISELVNKGSSLAAIKKEIEKCIILCSNCHRKLHFYNK